MQASTAASSSCGSSVQVRGRRFPRPCEHRTKIVQKGSCNRTNKETPHTRAGSSARRACLPQAQDVTAFGTAQYDFAHAYYMLNANQSAPSRFLLATDTHFWPPSHSRSKWMAVSDAASERDGLLIARSTSVLLRLLDDLAAFARGGGDGAIHLGDAVCGGGGFNQSADVYTSSLRWLRAMETRAAGNWPIHHVPGNHDLSPAGGGLRAWETTMAATCIRDSSSPEESIATCDVDGGSQPGADASPIYRSLPTSHPTWRLLLLNSTRTDTGT